MSSRTSSNILVAELTEAQAKAELKRLAAEIGAHDKRYYQDDAPTVSDADYDALRQRNEAIEARFPELVRADSPSRRVGAAAVAKFAKVRHAVPMLSLDNAFADEEVVDFVERIRRFLRLPAEENGRFHGRAEDRRPVAVAALRGRRAGRAAQPAATAPRARTSPPTSARSTTSRNELRGKGVPEVCEVRGEVYMTKSAFLALNERQQAAGEADLRQSAQLGGRLAAPARSRDHGVAPARLLRLCLGRDERDAGGDPIRHAQVVRCAAASRPTR